MFNKQWVTNEIFCEKAKKKVINSFLELKTEESDWAVGQMIIITSSFIHKMRDDRPHLCERQL